MCDASLAVTALIADTARLLCNTADVDEQSKREIKDILLQYDRTLLVADPRRCEPKKCVLHMLLEPAAHQCFLILLQRWAEVARLPQCDTGVVATLFPNSLLYHVVQIRRQGRALAVPEVISLSCCWLGCCWDGCSSVAV